MKIISFVIASCLSLSSANPCFFGCPGYNGPEGLSLRMWGNDSATCQGPFEFYPQGVVPQGHVSFCNSTLLKLCAGEINVGALQTGVFDGLPNLEQLDMGGTNLPYLPLRIFDKNTKLTMLELWYNKDLASIAPRVFDNLRNLNHLNLKFNPKLTCFPESIFMNLPSTIDIGLDPPQGACPLGCVSIPGHGNFPEYCVTEVYGCKGLPTKEGVLKCTGGIVRIDDFKNSTNYTPFMDGLPITKLDLSHNNISSLPSSAIRYLGGLKVLNLSGNSLVELLDNKVFSALSKLVTLDLSSNSLVTIAPGIFDPLIALENQRCQARL
jgi:Leucine-rich repeat (LRR) protein